MCSSIRKEASVCTHTCARAYTHTYTYTRACAVPISYPAHVSVTPRTLRPAPRILRAANSALVQETASPPPPAPPASKPCLSPHFSHTGDPTRTLDPHPPHSKTSAGGGQRQAHGLLCAIHTHNSPQKPLPGPGQQGRLLLPLESPLSPGGPWIQGAHLPQEALLTAPGHRDHSGGEPSETSPQWLTCLSHFQGSHLWLAVLCSLCTPTHPELAGESDKLVPEAPR